MGRSVKSHRQIFEESLQAARDAATKQPTTPSPDRVEATHGPYPALPELSEQEEQRYRDEVARRQNEAVEFYSGHSPVVQQIMFPNQPLHGARERLLARARQAGKNPEQFPKAPESKA